MHYSVPHFKLLSNYNLICSTFMEKDIYIFIATERYNFFFHMYEQ